MTLDSIHPKRLYTAKEAAEALGLHPDTVYRMGKQHRTPLPPVRVGPNRGRTRFRGQDILKYLGLEAA